MLEVITELERMGDYAKGIAKVTIRLGDADHPDPDARIFHAWPNWPSSMLHRALGAFIAENAQLAYEIPAEDDQVDDLYNQVYRSLVAAMIANPETIDQANLLMWVAHNLERMADRVTNICERTVFIATGELMEMDTDDEEINDLTAICLVVVLTRQIAGEPLLFVVQAAFQVADSFLEFYDIAQEKLDIVFSKVKIWVGSLGVLRASQKS